MPPQTSRIAVIAIVAAAACSDASRQRTGETHATPVGPGPGGAASARDAAPSPSAPQRSDSAPNTTTDAAIADAPTRDRPAPVATHQPDATPRDAAPRDATPTDATPRDASAAEAATPVDATPPTLRYDPNDPCIAAVQLDACCPYAIPVPTSAYRDDPCLIYWVDYGTYTPAGCVPPDEIACDGIDCDGPATPTDFALYDETGTCVYADMCQDATDCVVATSQARACACPAAHPRQVVEAEPCLDLGREATERCFHDGIIDCLDPCPVVTGATCQLGAFNRCVVE